jgi:dTDP-glucose pyrophosphorylase
MIPKNKKFDMTDLISLLRKQNKQIGVYPIEDNTWIDVGQWSEYRKAINQLV